MQNVYKILLEKSKDACIVSDSRLLFEFDFLDVIFDIVAHPDSRNYDGDSFVSLTPDDLQMLSKRSVTRCFLASSEYLGYRQDIIEYAEPVSITSKLYYLLRILNIISSGSVIKFYLTENYGYGDDDSAMFCEGEPNFIFEINLNENTYTDSLFFIALLEATTDAVIDVPPKFYWHYYKRYQPLQDSKILSIPITNTKSRRLGYFKLLGNLFKDNRKIAINSLPKKFELYSQQFENSLLTHSNNKGKIILSKSGISAKPYIDLARQLGLINQVNNTVSAGKLFKVYNILRNQLEKEEENIFKLTRLDKLFFIEILLREDFLYLHIILETLYIKGKTDFNYISEHFQLRVLHRANEFLESLGNERSNKAFKEIKLVAERVTSWKEPKKYAEHILMPRLNWLLDLKLIDMVDNFEISLTGQGQIFIQNLFYWDDINFGRVINSTEFLNHFHIGMFDTVFPKQVPESKKISDLEIVSKKALDYIGESFNHFRTLAPNRVTASQAITYAKYKLYLIDGISVGFRFITNLLEDKSQKTYVYKFQNQYGDGYIQKKIQ